jgi:outer membrane protein assembly factor BamB
MRNARRTAGVVVGCVVLLGVGYAGGQDWPQWRGPHRDNHVTGFAAPKTWPKALTKKWYVKVGGSDSSPVLVGDRVYVFSRQGDEEVTTCLKASNGDIIWQDKYAAAAVKGPAVGRGDVKHTGPRSTPAVAEGKICTLGVNGTVSCLDAAKGKVVWRKETNAKPGFYTSTSPLILDGKCIVYAGALTAFDLTSGEQKWAGPAEGPPPYGSPVVMTVAGTKQIVTPAGSILGGFDAADGKLLWQIPFTSKYNSATPVIDGQTVYASSPGAGTVALKIEKEGSGFVAKQLWKKKQSSEQYNSPVLHNGLLFGIADRSQNFYCMDAKTGDVLWTDSAKHGDCGNILDAGSVLLSLGADKNLVVFQPSPKAYTEIARYQVADTPTWAAPIIAGNRIFVKDQDTLTLWTIE